VAALLAQEGCKMDCVYRNGIICQLASSLAGVAAETNDQACQVCSSCHRPQSLNFVTASMAIRALPKPLPAEHRYLLAKLDPSTVGTELEKLISWFPAIGRRKCKRCTSLKTKLNQWGPDKCEENMEYIVKKMKITAIRKGIPFSEFAVRALVKKAIRNARKA